MRHLRIRTEIQNIRIDFLRLSRLEKNALLQFHFFSIKYTIKTQQIIRTRFLWFSVTTLVHYYYKVTLGLITEVFELFCIGFVFIVFKFFADIMVFLTRK